MPSARARLLRAHQVPEHDPIPRSHPAIPSRDPHSRDSRSQSYREPGILSGYRRPRSSVRECLRSVLAINNETLNVWTHLLPAASVPARPGYLLWLLAARLREPAGLAPFLAYLGTCALYPLASSAAHALGAMGGRGRHRAFCCDYAALGLYGLGSALAYSAYAFPLEWVGSTFHEFYVPVAVLNSALSTGLACYSRFLEAERPGLSRAFRTLAFVYPYLFDSIPVFYRLLRSAAGSCSELSLRLHSRHSLCALLTFLSFTSRLPERLAPGSFDIIGHSHQVFHICGILGTLFQLEAVSVDMAERRGRLPLPSSLETFGSLGMGAAASLAILGGKRRIIGI
ncbi:membrane progestin receptor gamma [Lonchura striata]